MTTIPDYIWADPNAPDCWVDAWNGSYTTLEEALEDAPAGVGRPWVLHKGEGTISEDEKESRLNGAVEQAVGIECKRIDDPVSGQPWYVCVLLPGRVSPGRPAYRFQGREAEIEFYDGRQDPEKFSPMGQFVSSYYVSTLVEHIGRSRAGLALYSDIPTWSVSHQVVELAVKHCIDVLHVHLDA